MTKSICEKKNPCELSYQQKILLKMLSCLYKQYVIGHLYNTNEYLANPSSDNYAYMRSELYLIQNTIQNNLPSSLFCTATATPFNPLARLVAWDAEGLVACDTQYNCASVVSNPGSDPNTFTNYDTSSGSGNKISGSNYNTRKGSVVLMTNEDKDVVLQIKPAQNHHITNVTAALGVFTYVYPLFPAPSPNRLIITEAAIYQRAGCAGIVNTGMVRLTIEVDMNCFSITPVKQSC